MELSLPSEDELISWLKDYSREEVITAANLSENSPFQTKAFLDNNLMEVRNEFIKEISGIIKKWEGNKFYLGKMGKAKRFINH